MPCVHCLNLFRNVPNSTWHIFYNTFVFGIFKVISCENEHIQTLICAVFTLPFGLYINWILISLKKTIILCGSSRAHYRTDFYVFGLQMTVEEWSSFLPRKNWGFQNASWQKMQLFFTRELAACQTKKKLFY